MQFYMLPYKSDPLVCISDISKTRLINKSIIEFLKCLLANCIRGINKYNNDIAREVISKVHIYEDNSLILLTSRLDIPDVHKNVLQ